MRIEVREYIEPESINEDIINAINTVKEYCRSDGRINNPIKEAFHSSF
ncbi:MAG: hypothetical protein ACLTY2_01860 [Coprococcus eutactus]